MRIPRIHTAQALSIGATIVLEEQASAHISRALRLPLDNPVRVFNGEGGEFLSRICAINKKSVSLLIESFQADNLSSCLTTHIAVGVSKGDKMDLIVQKSTELGVSHIYPIITERCDVKMPQERWQKKVDRWQEISISACEQSGRNSVPQVHQVQTFAQWLDSSASFTRCLFHPSGEVIFSAIETQHILGMAFGSEGGFSDTEIVLAKQSGCYITRLGSRVLRAETAPIAALAIAQAQWGDLLQ
jgi:16S rRNA (uracil1498-N3)-methyltransferase